MKANRSIKLLTASILSLFITPLFAQEYDDMYFSHSDRKSDKNIQQVVAQNTTDKKVETTKNPDAYGAIDQNYSSKNINPEYIARYRDSKDATDNTGTEGNSYYVDETGRDTSSVYTDRNGSVTNNNYYNSPGNYGGFNSMYGYNPYNSLWMDPFFSSPFYGPRWGLGVNYGFGFSPRWSLGFSYGNSWGYNPWSFGYDPWAWDFGYPGSYGYYSMYNPYYYGSYYSGMPYGVYNCWSCSYYDKSYSQNTSYGRRTFRGSDLATNTTVNPIRQRRIGDNTNGINQTSTSNTGARTRVASRRDYSASQNEYYSRANNTANTSNYQFNDRQTTKTYEPSRSGGSTYMNTTRTRTSPNTYNNYNSRPSYRTYNYGQGNTNNSYNYNRNTNSRPSGSNWNSGGNERSSRSYSGSSYSGGSSRSYSGGFSGGSSGRSSGGSSGSFSRGGGRR